MARVSSNLSIEIWADSKGRFVEGVDRLQLSLLPECLEDWVGEDNPVHVIEAFVDALGDRFVAAQKTYLPEWLGGNGQSYSDNLAAERGADQSLAQAHPFLTGTGQAIGGLALPVGAAGAASKTASIGGKVMAGAAAGTGIGAVQGISDAPDWTNGGQTLLSAGKGAILGGGIGGSLPILARGIGAAWTGGANKLVGGVDGVSSGAAAHLLPALEADGLTKTQAEAGRLGD